MFVKIKSNYIMKKLSILFSLFVLLTAFTCENEALDQEIVNQEFENDDNDDIDDNEDSDDNTALVGTWALSEFDVDLTSTTIAGGQEFVIEFTTTRIDSDYNLVFTETDYTVSGDYELQSSTVVNGAVNDSYTDTYTDVFGEGVYSTNGNVMSINGTFLDFEVDGMPADVGDVDQDANFELSNDGQTLTFTQDEEQIQTDDGFDVTTVTVATSVWQKID